MGYCPYKCIFCGYIEDNGWNGTIIDDDVASQLTGLPLSHWRRARRTEEECNDDVTLSVCDDCLSTIKCTVKPIKKKKKKKEKKEKN